MPNVGLTTASEPLPTNAKIIIRYSVEIEGLPVYQETYDADKLVSELKKDRESFKELWLRRVEGVAKARHSPEFSATLTRHIARGAE